MRVAASLSIVALLASASGCASSPAASALPPADETARVTAGGDALRIRPSDRPTAVPVALPIDEVWRVLPAVFDSLAIPVATLEPARRAIGNPGFKAHKQLGRTPLSRYIDCGQAQSFPSADTYDVHLSVLTQVAAGESGVTTVSTLVQASARPMTVSGDYSRCSSKGTLEARIVDAVKARLQRR
jgi:hypothetical protein